MSDPHSPQCVTIGGGPGHGRCICWCHHTAAIDPTQFPYQWSDAEMVDDHPFRLDGYAGCASMVDGKACRQLRSQHRWEVEADDQPRWRVPGAGRDDVNELVKLWERAAALDGVYLFQGVQRGLNKPWVAWAEPGLDHDGDPLGPDIEAEGDTAEEALTLMLDAVERVS